MRTLKKKDEKRILALETAQEQLENGLLALSTQWETELIRLSDLREQITNVLKRLEMRDRRAEKKNGDDPLPDPSVREDRVTQKILERRRLRHGVSEQLPG